MKPAFLRPQARLDRKDEVRYYRAHAGSTVAGKLVTASGKALDQLELDPGIGSPRLGQVLNVPGLRSWPVSGFPLLWFYFERDACLDVVRLLGQRQALANILGDIE